MPTSLSCPCGARSWHTLVGSSAHGAFGGYHHCEWSTLGLSMALSKT